MARLPKNSLFGALRGALGKEVVFKQYKDKVVVSRYPDFSRVKPTERQAAQRAKMKAAVAYAQKVLRDPALRAEMEKSLRPGESVYHKAKKQYFEKLKRGEKSL